MKRNNKELFFWKVLSDLWGIITAIFFLLTFFRYYDLSHVLADASIIYLSILSIFTGLKEFNRWKNKKFLSRYYGEIFVIAWTLIILIFVLMTAIDKNQYTLATEFKATYISVLGIFAISRKSKSLKLR
ncbi:MAG: hypothetical protein HOE19_00555 [Candidatus Komeilibacteria bacterium]|jgi:hypothetical protein|nr:hypothetical protein [Candidatus Komeilibacteria bacterium]MBT4447379.1 hypothetical protein [Candidatus Komeilibacteria bacterium]